MLIGITDKIEVEKLNIKLGRLLKPFITFNQEIKIGFKAERNYVRKTHNISYSEELGIWWLLDKIETRYWNCFGTDNPTDKKILNIIIEINMPYKGIDNRVSGIWAKDEANNYFLMHNGGIRGGKKNVNKKLFYDNFKGSYENVLIGDTKRRFAYVTNINSDKVGYQLAWFVKETQRIKSLVGLVKSKEHIEDSTGDINNDKNDITHSYNPEFHGNKTYGLPDEVNTDNNHGLVIEELKSIIEKHTPYVYNNKLMDLYTIVKNTNTIVKLFELKTTISRQNIYTAIGQLHLNSISEKPKPKLFFVCPHTIDNDLIKDLNKMDINVLTFKWDNEKPVFTNLEILNN